MCYKWINNGYINIYKYCNNIFFGDFNAYRNEFKNKVKKYLGNDFKYYYNNNINLYTRTKIIKNNIIENHI